MNIHRLLDDLYEEKKRLNRVIAALQLLEDEEHSLRHDGGLRRGRKSVGPEERRLISARMKNYWAARRDTEGPAA